MADWSEIVGAAALGAAITFIVAATYIWIIAALGASAGCPFCKGMITPWGLLRRHRPDDET